jgi:sortase A
MGNSGVVAPPAPGTPAAPGATPRGPRRRRRPPEPALRGVGVALLLLAAVVLGFAGYLYGLSGIQEARAQAELYQQLQLQLANEVAPLGAVPPGSPVAILNIPAIGMHDLVVVEGTSPADLTAGPGHLRDTPLPGQAGVSEILGRRATFGAPFGRLAQLRPGDEIQAITGQGYATYQVAAVSDIHQAINDQDPDRLVLVTASSAAVPTYDVTVDARLTSPAQAWLPPARTISTTELPLAGDGDALGLVVLWGLALAAVSAAGTFAAIRWARWPAYLVTVPIVLAVLWNLYQGLAELLPNVY